MRGFVGQRGQRKQRGQGRKTSCAFMVEVRFLLPLPLFLPCLPCLQLPGNGKEVSHLLSGEGRLKGTRRYIEVDRERLPAIAI